MDVQYVVCGGIDSIMVYGAICFGKMLFYSSNISCLMW